MNHFKYYLRYTINFFIKNLRYTINFFIKNLPYLFSDFSILKSKVFLKVLLTIF